MASEKILAQKEKEVEELAAKIKDAKIVLLTDYRGISVEQVTNLRSDLRKSNSEYKVIKNNITRRALAKCEYEGLEDLLVGPTAVIMNNEDRSEEHTSELQSQSVSRMPSSACCALAYQAGAQGSSSRSCLRGCFP